MEEFEKEMSGSIVIIFGSLSKLEAKKDSGTAIEPSDVKLESNPFDSCAEPAEGWKRCINKIPSFSPTNYLSTYNIYLYESTTKLSQISGVSIAVDNLVPIIKQFNVNTLVIGPATPLSYAYRIEDYAYIANDISKCAGIKEFRLYKAQSWPDRPRSESCNNARQCHKAKPTRPPSRCTSPYR